MRIQPGKQALRRSWVFRAPLEDGPPPPRWPRLIPGCQSRKGAREGQGGPPPDRRWSGPFPQGSSLPARGAAHCRTCDRPLLRGRGPGVQEPKERSDPTACIEDTLRAPARHACRAGLVAPDRLDPEGSRPRDPQKDAGRAPDRVPPCRGRIRAPRRGDHQSRLGRPHEGHGLCAPKDAEPPSCPRTPATPCLHGRARRNPDARSPLPRVYHRNRRPLRGRRRLARFDQIDVEARVYGACPPSS